MVEVMTYISLCSHLSSACVETQRDERQNADCCRVRGTARMKMRCRRAAATSPLRCVKPTGGKGWARYVLPLPLTHLHITPTDKVTGIAAFSSFKLRADAQALPYKRDSACGPSV